MEYLHYLLKIGSIKTLLLKPVKTFTMKYTKLIMTLIACCMLNACVFHAIYKEDIRQGQIISDSMVESLEKGMSKDKVAYILGSPVLNNYNDTRWEYIQYHKKQGKLLVYKKLVIQFRGDIVSGYTYDKE